MKRLIITLLTFCALFGSLGFTNAQAQEKIYSLAMKQQELEEAIRKSLSPYLQRSDYVIKVRIKGISRLDKVAKQARQRGSIEGALPGFEMESDQGMPSVTEIMGSNFWQISSIRIDMIMHKEISSSINTFIRETVPVVGEMDFKRGDKFNFIPIRPMGIGEQGVTVKDASGRDVVLPASRKYYGLAGRDWLWIVLGMILLIVITILIWRMKSMSHTITALDDMIEKAETFAEDGKFKKSATEILNEKEERLEKQAAEVAKAMLVERNEAKVKEIVSHLVGRKEWCRELGEEMTSAGSEVGKLAKLFNSLGVNISRRLFLDAMGQEQYLELEQMASEVTQTPEEESQLLLEVQRNLFAKKVMAPELSERNPFAFFKSLNAGQVEFLIKDEPVAIKAVALSRLSGEDVAKILSRMPKQARSETIIQLGRLRDMPMELMEKVAFGLADKARHVPDADTASFDGVDMVVDVMSEADSQVRNEIINNLRTSDRNLSAQVEKRFFLFDSIPMVPNEALVQVVRSLPADDVITALVGAKKEVQEKVILCFPEKIRRTLVSSLKSKKADMDMIKAKRKIIIKAMQKLADQGQVNLSQIQAAWARKSGAARAS